MNKNIFARWLRKRLVRIFIPRSMRLKMDAKKQAVRLARIKEEIFAFIAKNPCNDDDITQALDFLKNNDLGVFPYPFSKKYNPRDVEIIYDKKTSIYYTVEEGKRLYYKKRQKADTIPSVITCLRTEQDPESPHRYISDDFNISEGEIIADVGAAEGNFSLSIIENAGHIYLFEGDTDWEFPLKTTFAPWAYKITIVKKFVSDSLGKNYITLDDFFKDKTPPTFIKMDTEGFELKILQGASRIINESNFLRIAVCAYHRQSDEKNITDWLVRHSMNVTPVPKKMIFLGAPDLSVPYFRRGILRATKSASRSINPIPKRRMSA